MWSKGRLGWCCRGCFLSESANQRVPQPGKIHLFGGMGGRRLQVSCCLGFAIKAGSPGDFNQILIMGGAVNLGLCGTQSLGCGLHSCSSILSSVGDGCSTDRQDYPGPSRVKSIAHVEQIRPTADSLLQIIFVRSGQRDLMYSTRRKRRAVQSSSMAMARTVSKPAAFKAFQPVSRLKSHLYFFDVPLG